MNKLAKYSILLGLALIFLSVILSARNLDNLWRPFYTNLDYTRSEFVSTSEINSILVDTTNMRVEIRPYGGDSVRIIYAQSNRNPIRVAEDNGRLSLIRERSGTVNFSLFSFNFNMRSPEIIIEVPTDLILEYNISTSNSRIYLRDLMVMESTFRTSNNSVTIRNMISEYNVEIRTSNGRINLNHVEVARLIAETSNSRIVAEDVEATTITFTTSNSPINADNILANEINLRTSNGRIEGTIIGNPNDFEQEMRTSNGRITINGNNHGTNVNNFNNADYRISARTSNSHINLNFR